ncbi:MAG: DUF4124 domain-containing protein [Deltaproteobacteria bacterium]|nr:DUF4124 domain-containing protein [Deltaproteobacteria bacterium]
MKKSIILCAIIFLCLLAFQVNAGSVYSWKDENGVKQYSNTPPAEGTGDFEITEEMPHDPRSSDKNQERQRLINELKVRNQAAETERKKEEEEREIAKAEEKAKAQNKISGKVQVEKERLLAEIKKYEQLAVTATFSLALKESIIKQLKDKITLLEQSPETYFKSKDK